jgi:hypothetical protein
MKIHRSVVIASIALASFPAVPLDNARALEDFTANRAKWNVANIHDYEVQIRDGTCWCLFGPAYGPIRNFVRSGLIVKAMYEGERRNGYWPGRTVHIDVQTKATIEDVFARAALLLQGAPAGTFKIEYDPTYGFPVLIDFDDPQSEDEQWRLTLDGFKILSR